MPNGLASLPMEETTPVVSLIAKKVGVVDMEI